MIVSIIVAMGKNGEIGKDNKMPWHIPFDLKRFKAITMGHHIVVGHKTFDSIGGPLSGRKMIVLTNNVNLKIDDCFVANSLEQACAIALKNGEKELFICGGSNVYKDALKIADKIYLTKVDYHGPADTFFPPYDFSKMHLVESERFEKSHPRDYSWVCEIYSKK